MLPIDTFTPVTGNLTIPFRTPPHTNASQITKIKLYQTSDFAYVPVSKNKMQN
jgi:hypothetical protein